MVRSGRDYGAAPGVLLWVLFCFAAVIVRGVRWDEQYEFAQMLTRQIPYPEGHPYLLCVRNALNLQIYSTAALLALWRSPALVCGARNVLFLMATVLPVFVLARVLSRRTAWAHAAVVFTLIGAHLEFDSCYPMATWGRFFSTGHVGMGYALLTLAALLAERWRTGAFLLGLMPVVHVGQMPVLLLFAGLRIAALGWDGARNAMWQFLRWGVAGLFASALFALTMMPFRATPPTGGPYYSDADPAPICRAIIASDPHRAAPGGPVSYTNSNFILGATLLLGAAAVRQAQRQRENAAAWLWTYVYIVLAASAVWGMMALHYALGPNIPHVLLAWMPYRMSNHVVVILLAAFVGILGGVAGRGNRDVACTAFVMFAGALLYVFFRPMAAMLMSSALYTRYWAAGDSLIFGLCGVAWMLLFLLLKDDRRFLIPWVALSLAAFGILPFFHRFGAFCCVTGAIKTLILHVALRWAAGLLPALQDRRVQERVLGVVSAIVLAALAYAQWQERQWLPRTEFDGEVAAYLDARGERDALLVARPDQYTLQAQTGHPVMVDGALAPWIPYMPSVGPAIAKIYADLYGTEFLRANTSDSPAPGWTEVWTTRDTAQWRALGTEYGFRYVVSPNSVPLHLPIVVHGGSECLYEVL
jgi:hypothetical protein